MRRKNGYTLTEILVVVLLLSIVGGIIIFNVNVVLNNNKTKSYEKYIAQVKSSAETYASLNQDAINDLYENKSYTYVKVGDLIDHGFLDEKLTNPYTGEKISREELVKLSLSTETGNLTITYPVVEENKEVFLSSVVLSKTVGNQVDCMEGIGTYTLALSDETGKLILDKNTLINDYNFSCKLPDNFTKTAGTMNNEIGSTEQVGTYEITYNWISKSGTKGTGTRFLKVVPGTIKLTYNVDVLEGKPADAWTPATCMGTISEDGICSKNILVNYNYNTLSKPYRRGYTLLGWYTEKQTDPENPGINGNLITENTKVLNKEDHTIYAHWDRKRYGVTLDSTLNGRPAISPGTQTVTAKYNLPLEDIEIPTRYFDIVFNKNDVSESNGTTEATISHDNLVATWDFKGYYSSSNDMYIDETGKGIKNWDIDEETILKAKWENGRITLPDASRPGYTFEGWYTGATGGELRDNDYQYEMSDVLYAQWKPITYVAKLNYNDDDGGSTKANETIKQINVTFDSNFENLFDASRTGYMFEGWYTNDGRLIEKSTLATNDYQIVENEGIELTAKWSKIKYAISLDLNKQAAMSSDPSLTGSNLIEVTFDEAVNNLEVLSVIGWTFDGWYDSDNLKVFNSDGSINFDTTKYIDSNSRWIYPDGLSLYAHWSQKNYTLTLDLNRPAAMSHTPVFNPDHSNTYQMTYDSTNNNIIVTGNVEGWTFKGWYDSTGDMVYDSTGKYVESSKNYFKNAKWHYDNDLTIYAHWEQNSFILSLDVNRPSNMSTAPSIETNTYINVFDDEAIKTINAASTTGWTFNGWYDSSNELIYDNEGNYNPEVTKYINSDGKWIYSQTLELYAHWTANKYEITLNKQNGSGGTNSVTATYDSPMPAINAPTRVGYTYLGYYETETNDVKYYEPSGASTRNWNKTSDATLYARWSPITSTVTLNKNEGTGGTNSVTATYDSPMPVITVPTRVGYTFLGYYETATNDVQYYQADGTSARSWNKTGDTTLYAHWSPITSKVTFDKQGGKGGTDNVTATYDSAMPTITIPNRAGLAFDGYYTEPNGGSKYYQGNGTSASNWNRTSDTTLHAHWSGLPYFFGVENALTAENANKEAQTARNQGYTATSYDSAFSYWDLNAPGSDGVRLVTPVSSYAVFPEGREDYQGSNARNSAHYYIDHNDNVIGWDYNANAMIVEPGETVNFRYSFQTNCQDNNAENVPLCSDVTQYLASVDLFDNDNNTLNHWQSERYDSGRRIDIDVSWTNDRESAIQVNPRGHIELQNNSTEVLSTSIYVYCYK